MKTKYVFWITDGSFSWNGPFGTQIEPVFEENGFEIEIDKNNEPLIETLKGFGAFEDVEKCKTLIDLYCYIEENKKYVNEETDEIKSYATLEALLRLQSKILNSIRKGLNAA